MKSISKRRKQAPPRELDSRPSKFDSRRIETLRFNADLSELDRLAEDVRAFAQRHGLDSRATHDILLALDELLTNVITYGMPHQPVPVIEIAMDILDGAFTAEMRDNGGAFDPGAEPAPDLDAPLEERRPGGLGIFLARARMDRMDYRREDGWNIVTLRKAL